MNGFIEYFVGHQEIETVFRPFGFYHMTWLVVAIAATLFFANINRNEKTERILAITVFVSQILTMTWYMFGPMFWQDGLPFYTCRIAAIAFGIGYFRHNSFLKALGTYLGFIGGIIALMNPVLFPYKIWHFCNINFFVFHIALLGLSSYYLTHYGETLRKHQLKVQRTVLELMVFIAVVNFIIGSNYSYAASAPLLQEKLNRLSWLTYFALLNIVYQSAILAEGRLIQSPIVERAATVDLPRLI